MLEITPGDDARSLVLSGELDLATTPLLLERAGALLEQDGDVTLELSDVLFIDSQGVRGFIHIARGLGDRGRLVLSRPSPEVRKLFEIVRIDDFPNIMLRD